MRKVHDGTQGEEGNGRGKVLYTNGANGGGHLYICSRSHSKSQEYMQYTVVGKRDIIWQVRLSHFG